MAHDPILLLLPNLTCIWQSIYFCILSKNAKFIFFFHNFVLFGRCFRCLLVTINDFVHRYVSHHILNSLVINQTVKNLQSVPLSIVILQIIKCSYTYSMGLISGSCALFIIFLLLFSVIRNPKDAAVSKFYHEKAVCRL